ncbi:MAG: PAS domain S-box protein [Hydrogenophaga sp.]|uniref:sensor histidine kinase n=1 Tax=Hydrogenophaga sp. TaxID=1904254 RepID=UPI0026369E90|nr:PAS domain S-box protein [Hydrogenophaga sp.]MCV0441117.1 PAS domain S-box protein [Hydrogenophaga sp.]
MNARRRNLVALVAAMTLLATGFLWWQSDRAQAQLREQVLAQAEQRSLQLADAMGGQVEALIASVDVALQDLRREWLLDPEGFDPMARVGLATLPPGMVTHLSVANAEGQVVYDSLGMRGPTHVGDREHFQAQRNGGGVDRTYIGKPVHSRIAKEWTVVINRPILRDGRFDGTVNLLVSTTYLAGRLASLQLSGKDVVSLIDRRGNFLARSRDNLNAMASRVPSDRPYLIHPEQTSGIYHVSGLLDEIPRTYGWQRLASTGLVMVVGLADESVLAPLAPALARSRAIMALLSVLLVALGGVVMVLLSRVARHEAAVAASEAFRIRLFESSHVSTVVIDARTERFIDCNHAACRIYGYAARADVLGKTPADVSAARQYDGTPSIEKARAYMRQAQRDRGVVFEWLHERPDGTRWDGEVHLMSFESEGRVLMQFTLHDITARKRAEAALRESEARLKEAQGLARIGNWQRDLVGNVLAWSDEVYRIYEIDPSQKPAFRQILSIVHPDDRELVTSVYNESVRTRQPYDVVHRLRMSDGRIKHVRQCGFSQYEGDRAVHSTGTVQDITDLRNAQESLRHLNEELERRVAERTHELSILNRELEAFAYSVSHDLRTPLRSVDGYASLLADEFGADLTPEGRSYVERIRKSARRMGQLITDMLRLAHLNRAELRHQPVNLSEMARLVAAELAATAPDRQVSWHIDDGMAAFADQGLMRVVLQNLLGNAWKYTAQSADAVIAFTQLPRSDGLLEFCVRDNGAGFDMTYAGQLFEPFKRLHAHHEFEGTGVGLTTVQRVIERHGGWVRGEGAVGEGAAFFFTLPARTAAQ